MNISRKQQIAAALLPGVLFLFSGCTSTPKPRPGADARAGALSHFSLGLLAEAGSESDAAFGHFESAIRLDPDEETLYAPAVALALKLEKTNDAARLSRELIKRRPGTAEPQLLLARVHAVTGQPDQAEHVLKKAIKAFPDHPDAPVMLARLYLSLDRFPDAFDVIRAAAERQSKNAEMLHLLGTLHIEKAREADSIPQAKHSVMEGIGFLRKALTLSPEDPLRWQQLAFALLAVQEPEEAETVLLEALGHCPDEGRLRIVLGTLHLQTERYEEAFALFDSVRRETPAAEWSTDPIFLLHFLFAAQKSDRPEEAVAILDVAPDMQSAVLGQYMQALLAGQSPVSAEESADLLTAFFKLNPEAAEALYYLMALQAEQKEYEAAIESARQFETLVQQAGKPALLSGQFYYQYAALHERAGQLEPAEELFYKAIELGDEPVASAAQNYIAYMWAERGEKLETGLDLIRKALSADSDNAAFLDTLGWIYYMQGRYAEALEELKKALEITGSDPVIWEHLGDTYIRLGDREAAVQHWKKALELDPDSKKLADKIENPGSVE